jgi:hypothetical protein
VDGVIPQRMARAEKRTLAVLTANWATRVRGGGLAWFSKRGLPFSSGNTNYVSSFRGQKKAGYAISEEAVRGMLRRAKSLDLNRRVAAKHWQRRNVNHRAPRGFADALQNSGHSGAMRGRCREQVILPQVRFAYSSNVWERICSSSL